MLLKTIEFVFILTVTGVCQSAKIFIHSNEDSSPLYKGIPGLSIENLKLDDSRARSRTTTTPVPTTTSTKATTSNIDGSTDVLYRLDNTDGRACVLMLTDALIEIDYVTSLKEKKKSNIYLPENYQAAGLCEEDFSLFSIVWPYYKLTIQYAKNPGRDHWYVKRFQLDADLNDKHLAHVNRAPGSILHFSSPEGKNFFPTPVGKAFTCTGEHVVEMADNEISASLYLRELKMQPFIYKNDEFGPEHACTTGANSYRDETAPIAVGSTFAIFTILMVAGYGVYRYMKVKKVQYDTME